MRRNRVIVRNGLGLVLLILGLCLVSRSLWRPWSAMRTSGVVMIDDRLSGEWAPAGRLCEWTWFGDFSSYGLSGWAELLGRTYTVVVNADVRYDREVLQDVAVLVLKIPEVWIDAKEVDAIVRWCAAGGRLFLIGDHTDLSGSSGFLNELASLVGIEFANDCVADVDNGGLSFVDAQFLGRDWFGGHGGFTVMSQCSVACSGWAVPLMGCECQAATAGDYGGPSNFGDMHNDAARAVGRKTILAGGRFGDGQVVAWSDGTVLSTFALGTEGRGEFFERLVHWIYGQRIWTGGLRLALLLAGCAMAGCGCWLLRAVLRTLQGAVIAVAMGVYGGWWWNCDAFAGVAACHRDVMVVEEGCAAFFPPAIGSSIREEEASFAYDTVLMGLWRSGLAAQVVSDWRVWCGERDCEAMWWISPREVEASACKHILSRVEAGGILVVGVRGAKADAREYRIAAELGFPSSFNGERIAIGGGQEVWLEGGQCGVRERLVGRGRILLVFGVEVLSRAGVGHVMEVPSPEQRQAYELLRVVCERLGMPARELRSQRISVLRKGK